MHGGNGTLAISLSACLLGACASSPPPQPAGLSDPPLASAPPLHQTFFANMVAVVAAMGGGNPNAAYHALNARDCPRSDRLPTPPRPTDSSSGAEVPQRTAASAACERIATAK